LRGSRERKPYISSPDFLYSPQIITLARGLLSACSSKKPKPPKKPPSKIVSALERGREGKEGDNGKTEVYLAIQIDPL
jgi:hypothetical protein